MLATAAIDPWHEIPEDDRLEWCRALLDFIPEFPGVAVMAGISPAVNSGRVIVSESWIEQATAFHRLGFTPADWYLLRLCVERRRDCVVGRADGRFAIDTSRRGVICLALIADDWAEWVELVRSGLTPMRAVDRVLLGARSSN